MFARHPLKMSKGGCYWGTRVVPWSDDSKCAWRGKRFFFLSIFLDLVADWVINYYLRDLLE